MIEIALNSHRVANKSQLRQVPPNSFSSDCSEFLSRKSHVVASIFERDNGKKLYCLKQRRATFKARKFKPQIRGYHGKNFTALNKEQAKFFPLSFDFLLTFRTLKVQCFQGISASHQEGVGIYVPPTHISHFYCYMSRIFEAKNYATLNKE